MTRLIFVDGVEEEVQDAARYYDRQMPGLGQHFLDEIQHATDQIVAHPSSGQILRGSIRRRLVRRFPFGILYRIDPQEIVKNCRHAPAETPWILGGPGDDGLAPHPTCNV